MPERSGTSAVFPRLRDNTGNGFGVAPRAELQLGRALAREPAHRRTTVGATSNRLARRMSGASISQGREDHSDSHRTTSPFRRSVFQHEKDGTSRRAALGRGMFVDAEMGIN